MKKTKGIIIRAKARWVEEGEKSTKYFLKLESRNYKRKIISRLYGKNGDMISDSEGILIEQMKFYKELYNCKKVENGENEIFFPIYNRPPALTGDLKALCEGHLTLTEAFESINSMKNGKSPGTDGYTVEFFKFFWLDLGQYLVDALNYNFEKGIMSVEQRRGILCLLPKKDKNLLYLANWRPLSLLNLDYKQ